MALISLKAPRSRTEPGTVYLCNIPSGANVAGLLGPQGHVLSYDWPLSSIPLRSNSITFLRVELEHMESSDIALDIQRIATRARKRGGFIALCSTPRLGEGTARAQRVGRANALSMRIAAQAELGFFDLDLILALRGALMISATHGELSKGGAQEVADALRPAIEKFTPTVRSRVSWTRGIFRCCIS